ncbi:odorant receptor 82a-like [Culicoides brevitarsis]|uniref:odorant receptor 82a-like n=1 Tax=Culicoides brevitarsis TaxID=469753 RepID=UPI00307B1637
MKKFTALHQFYRKILSQCGFDWTFDYFTLNLRRQKIICAILVFFLYLNTFNATIFLSSFESFGIWAVCVIFFCAGSFSCLAALLLFVYGKECKYLLDWCSNLYISPTDVRLIRIHDDIFRKAARETILLAKVTFYGFKFLLIVIFLPPIPLYFFTGTVMLPATFYFPGLPYTELPYYLLNYISQFLGVYCATSVTPILHSILVMVVIHAKYQLDLVDATVEVIINDGTIPGKEKDVKGELEEIIKMHTNVLGIIRLASRVFSMLLLAYNSAVYFIIGFTFVATQLDKSLIIFSPVAIVSVVYLGLISYFGSVLYERLTSVGNAIYCSNWYLLPVKHQKTLKLVILQSQRSKPLTAGDFIDLSLVSFLNNQMSTLSKSGVKGRDLIFFDNLES